MKSKIITLTAGLALLIGNAIFAQEIKWTGAGDGVYWEDDANWDGTFRPTDTDWALFDSSGTTVALNSTAGVGGMIFSSGGWNFSGGNLNLGKMLTVDGTITNVGLDATQLQGLVSISGNIILDAQQQNWLVATGGTLSLGVVKRGTPSEGKFITIGGYGYNGTVIFGGGADNDNLGVIVNGGLAVFNKNGIASYHAAGAGLTINSGTVRLDGNNGDQIYNNVEVKFGNGGVLDLNGRNETVANLSEIETGSGRLTNSDALASSTLTFNGKSTGRTVFTGSFDGNLTVVVNGGIMLDGSFTNTGDIIVTNAPTVKVEFRGNLINNTGKFVARANANEITVTSVIGSNVTQVVQEGGSKLVLSNTVQASGGVLVSGTGQVDIGSVLEHDLLVRGGRVYFTPTGTLQGGLTIESGTVNIANGALNQAQWITLGSDTVSGLVMLNTYADMKNQAVTQAIDVIGSGTRVINATNYAANYTGAITLYDNTNLYVITDNARGSAYSLSGGITGTGNLVLQVNGTNTKNSQLKLQTGAVNIAGTITNSGTGFASEGEPTNTDVTISAVIGDKVTGVIQNSANSKLILGGVNTYSGSTSVSTGILLVNGAGRLLNTSGVYVNTGGTFQYNSTGGALERTVQLDGGAFHHNAATNMGGALVFNSGKLAGTNWNGAVLSGLTINTGKIIAPGNSIGIAGTESQTWGVGGAYEFELGNVSGAAGADWDLLNVSGALDISSLSASSFTLQLTGLGLSGFDAGQSYDWDFVHFGSLTGTFDGDLFTVDASGFGAAYDGEFSVIQSGGNILALHYEAIPEPSVLALLGVGGVILLIARRRK